MLPGQRIPDRARISRRPAIGIMPPAKAVSMPSVFGQRKQRQL
jgi:hypothetical protein